MTPLAVRAETPADRERVFLVNAEAFGREDEARLVEALRGSPAFLPELSRVAVRDGQVVGQILFSRVAVRSERSRVGALALAPMAVLSAQQ
jgi:putative acetyltransferase